MSPELSENPLDPPENPVNTKRSFHHASFSLAFHVPSFSTCFSFLLHAPNLSPPSSTNSLVQNNNKKTHAKEIDPHVGADHHQNETYLHLHAHQSFLLLIKDPRNANALSFFIVSFCDCLHCLHRKLINIFHGAVRAVLTQHFALQNNAADISGKEGSQETVATMIAMASGSFPAKCMKDPLIGVFSVRDLVLGFDNIVFQADLYVDEGAIQELKSSERQPENGKGGELLLQQICLEFVGEKVLC
uniref:Protein root UVB sensitive/RUS domain-containing protein n=1 Tax=Tanacetum cinerariifolium TaxID=118510 RepID=A0A699HVQ9_TANCI|nr:hypothetical protein [Tanacetum cinerariifolium]